MESEIAGLKAELNGRLDVNRVTQGTSITEAGWAVDARQMNPEVDGSLANQLGVLDETVSTNKAKMLRHLNYTNANVTSLAGRMSNVENKLGKIIFGSFVGDPGGKNYIELPIKTKDIFSNNILAINGDYVAFGGFVIGFSFYNENVRCILSDARSGATRINYIYFHV